MPDQSFTDKLVSLGSNPISALRPEIPSGYEELRSLLEMKNGFFCFEGALQVYSTDCQSEYICLRDWNAPNLWRFEYMEMDDPKVLFFAQDIFGCQFGMTGQSIVQFDPETGSFENLDASIEDWARRILSNYRAMTGYPIAHNWQVANGRIRSNYRLIPITPFVLGGAFELGNLFSAPMIEGMVTRAAIARQIRDVPDGGQIRLVVTD